MRNPFPTGKTLLCCLLLPFAAGVQARGMTVGIDTVRSEAGAMSGVQARLSWPDGSEHGQLELRVSQLDFPLLSYRADDVVWRCPLQPDGDGAWACAGPVQARGVRDRQLAMIISPAATRVELDGGGTRISYENQAASPDLSRVVLQDVPVAWLQAFLAQMWADGQWTAGNLDGRIDVLAADAGMTVNAGLELEGVGLETPDGIVAAAGLSGRLLLDYRERDALPVVQVALTTTGGEFLADSLYMQLPSSPVQVRVDAEADGAGGWRLPRIAWNDGDVLVANGSATLAGDASVRDLLLDLRLGDLAIARDRYLSGFLAPAGFGGLVLTGAARAQLQLQNGALRALSLAPEGITAIDPGQRFTLAGLTGDLAWRADGDGPAGSLGWDGGALFGIGIGPATLAFASEGGQLKLVAPARVAVLGGGIAIDDLRWQPPDATHGTRFQLGVTMDALDLGSLSQRLGWPDFEGTLAGRIPSARFADNMLTLDGGLRFDVFGGTVALTQLVLERPFGVAPSLSADVAIDDIDMEPLTAAFGFGAITGRLDGRIAAIRMVDWDAVAFDARLDTDPAWQGRRRISQRAIEDISNVGGGGGLMGGLQAQALRLFEDFGYRRIGLGCRLRDEVCTLSGLDSGGDSYTIVEGAGMPRVTVVGHRRLVDWPTLVERLVAATEGTAPVIQ